MSVATAHLCHQLTKSASTNMQTSGHSCVPIKLYLQIKGSHELLFCLPLIETFWVLFCDYLRDTMPKCWIDCVFPTIYFGILSMQKFAYYMFLSNNNLTVKLSLLFFPPSFLLYKHSIRFIEQLLSNKQNSRHWRNNLKDPKHSPGDC